MKDVKQLATLCGLSLVPLTIHVIRNYFYYRRGWNVPEVQIETILWIVRLLLAPLIFLYIKYFWIDIGRWKSFIIVQIAGFITYLILHWSISMVFSGFIELPDGRIWNLFHTIKNSSLLTNVVLYSVTVFIYYMWVYHERGEEARKQTILLEKSLNESMHEIQHISEQLQSKTTRLNPVSLSIKTGQRAAVINFQQIVCFLANGPYIKVVTETGTPLLSMSMRELEKIIPDTFQRVHRSSIVNTGYITQVKSLLNGDYVLLLKNGKEIRVSRTYREKLRAALGRF